MIRGLKSLYYAKEVSFAEEYDKTGTFKEIKISELTMSKNEEKLEITYLNKERELSPTTTTGRKTGKMSFTKNVDTSLLANHKDLISAALGKVETTVATQSSSAAAEASGIITFTVGSDWSAKVGEAVKIKFSDDTYSSYNIIASADATSLTLKFPVTDASIAKLAVSGIAEITTLEHCVLGKPDSANSFIFVAEFDENAPEVYRGCGVTAKMEFGTAGQGQIMFEVEAAKAGPKDDSNVFYENITGTKTAEGEHKAVMYDFLLNYVSDMAASPAPLSLIPQKFDLQIANSLVPFGKQGGGTNNIGSYYTKGAVTAEAHYDRTPEVLNLFDTDNENTGNQYVFLSQEKIALWTAANFTNQDNGTESDFDAVKCNVDVNFSTTVECRLILPQ